MSSSRECSNENVKLNGNASWRQILSIGNVVSLVWPLKICDTLMGWSSVDAGISTKRVDSKWKKED